MTKPVRIEAPIKGALGNEIQVGDTVMVVTTGWGNTHCAKGKYIGYVEGKGYYKKRAQVEVQEKSHRWVHQDGTPFDWKTYDYRTWEEVRKTLKQEEHHYTRVTTLNLNRMATLKD